MQTLDFVFSTDNLARIDWLTGLLRQRASFARIQTQQGNTSQDFFKGVAARCHKFKRFAYQVCTPGINLKL